MLNGIDDAVAATSDAAVSVRGRLRINVDAFSSRLLLAQHLGPFLDRHPHLTLDIVARDRLGDMVGDGFDLAIRFGKPPESSLVAKKLLETSTVTVASSDYLKRCGAPETPSQLSQHACILVRDSGSGEPIEEWCFTQGNRQERVKVGGRLMVAEFGTMLAACVEGVGIARVKAIGVQRMLEQGVLAEVLPDWVGDRFPLYALYAARHLPPAKVRAFVDFIAERLPSVSTCPLSRAPECPL